MPIATPSRLVTGATIAVLAMSLAACGGCGDETKQVGSSAPVTPADGAVADRVVQRLLEDVHACDVEHRGLLVDFGTGVQRWRLTGFDTHADPISIERGGATWSTITKRRFDLAFTLAEPTRVFVGARIEALEARGVSFSIDDQTMGSARLKQGEPRIVETAPTELAMDPGEHTLTVRFTGSVKDGEAFADLDWLRVGFPDELKATYGAPTFTDVVSSDAVLDRVPHRALSLRVPGLVRCPVRVPVEGRLRTSVGMIGGDQADIEIAVRVDGEAPVSLVKKTVRGGDAAKWEDLDVPLSGFAGKIVQLELRAPTGAATGRVLFGDPEIVVPSVEPPGAPQAQVVVVVVLAGIEKQELPGYGTIDLGLEHLTRISQQSTVFEKHRGATTVVPSSLATLLTGLPVESHTVTDYGARLPASLPTITQRAHEASIQTGFFTGVPHSFQAFGFGAAVSHFAALSPTSGDPKDPVAEASRWITETLERSPQAKIFAVVHARGGHPPWTVSAKQLESLPPENYTGDFHPRRAAQQLSHLRRRKSRLDVSDQDMTRLRALHQVALLAQDQYLGDLVEALDGLGVDDRTLLIVTSDASSGLDNLFADDGPITEPALALPLYVRFPGGKYAGRRVEVPTEVADVTRTVLSSLELPVMKHGRGRDLANVATGLPLDLDGPLVANAADVFLIRWGDVSLRSRGAARATLCDLVTDPTCAFDRRAVAPFMTFALLRDLALQKERARSLAVQREPATIDDETLAALRVWGSME